MKVILDTNVMISALWEPRGPSGRIVAHLLRGRFTALLDQRLIDELQRVLVRPKFKFDPERVEELCAYLAAKGEKVESERYEGTLPDEDDRHVVEIAISGEADSIVTGNLKDFPEAIGVPVLTPAAFIRLLEGESA